MALGFTSLSLAENQYGWQALVLLAEHFIQQNLADQPVNWSIGNKVAPPFFVTCPHPKITWANGGFEYGKTFLQISCLSHQQTIRLPVIITKKHFGLILTRPIMAGEILTASDVTVQEIKQPALARHVLTETTQAIGQAMKSSAPSGAWLRRFMIHRPFLIKANQKIKLQASGEGFIIQSEGVALNNAAEGDSVSVRLPSKRLARGTVLPDGSVMIE